MSAQQSIANTNFISFISELPSSHEIEVSVPANHSKFWYHGGKSMEVNKTADKYRVLPPFYIHSYLINLVIYYDRQHFSKHS